MKSLLLSFLLIISCGKNSDRVGGEGVLFETVESHDNSAGVNADSNIGSDATKLSVFPVLLNDIVLEEPESVQKYTGNDTAEYIIKEKFVSEKLLNRKYDFDDIGLLARSVLLKRIRRKIDRLIFKFSFDERIIANESKLRIRSIRLSVFRKRMLEDQFSYYGEVDLDFLRDYRREITAPLFFNDQSFEVDLPKPIFPNSDDLYLFRVTKAEFIRDGFKRSLTLDEVIEKEKNCYFSILETNYFVSSKKINCLAYVKKRKKVVLDDDQREIVSINNHNNNFLIDPPTFKLEFNNLNTSGYYSSKLNSESKNFFISFFNYKDLLEVIPYKSRGEVVLKEIDRNFLNLTKLTKINTHFKKTKSSPVIESKKRKVLVRSLGSRVGDADYFTVSSDLRSYLRQDTSSKYLKKSRSFKINESTLEVGPYLVEKDNEFINNKVKKLKKKKYQLGDSANVERYMVISSDYVKKYYSHIEDDHYEQAFLEVFLPNW